MTDDKIQEDLFERLNYGVFHAAALKAGIHLDLFTPLKDGPMSLEQLARSLGVDALRLRPLLYALVVVGLLNVDSDRFANTADADRYLVGDSPDNRLENLKGYANRWDIVLKTAESIRTGVPQSKIDYETMLPKDLEAFLRGLHWGTMREGQALAESYDFSSFETLLDVGGGSGGLALAMTEAYPNLTATVVDLPSVTPITQVIMEEEGATDRVQVVTADVVNGTLSGSFDVAIMRAFINVLSPNNARKALINIGQVINPGGIVYILGGFNLENSRVEPADLAVWNILMVNIYDGGQCHTFGDQEEWLVEAGFGTFERGPDGGIVARKPI